MLPRAPGDLYDRLGTPVRALRYGGLTIIVDERARIFCVDRNKQLVWDLGGSRGGAPVASTMVLPTYIHITRRGTFLVTDHGRNMIFEMNPFLYSGRREKDGYLFRDCETADDFAEGGIMETRGYREKNLQVYNTSATAELCWRLLASHNAANWQVVQEPENMLATGAGTHLLIDGAWNFLKVEARSANRGIPANISAFLTMQR